ncbi:MAG: hypothetical protein BJ554DRAFT_856 [Olpidium bornovanus]|uniref:VHS domain-containing protein n=1 Tax=Olpidium bornovanus TaxID=278681 RepID=A0A8H7ZSR7_9FUNG|nr:MAG: hypothetical protein BJ554DRAFT_856 [Olpidium bornovanus]
MTPVQRRILELIQEWQSTIAQTSPYKEDLRHIDDMYRLLSYKGILCPVSAALVGLQVRFATMATIVAALVQGTPFRASAKLPMPSWRRHRYVSSIGEG